MLYEADPRKELPLVSFDVSESSRLVANDWTDLSTKEMLSNDSYEDTITWLTHLKCIYVYNSFTGVYPRKWHREDGRICQFLSHYKQIEDPRYCRNCFLIQYFRFCTCIFILREKISVIIELSRNKINDILIKHLFSQNLI